MGGGESAVNGEARENRFRETNWGLGLMAHPAH